MWNLCTNEALTNVTLTRGGFCNAHLEAPWTKLACAVEFLGHSQRQQCGAHHPSCSLNCLHTANRKVYNCYNSD